MTKAYSTVHKVYRWEDRKEKLPVPPTSKYSLVVIDLTCKALAMKEELKLDNYKAPPDVDLRFFNDCTYKDFFGACFHKLLDFGAEELKQIIDEVLCFFNILGFPMSVMVTYYRAKPKFSNECSLTLDLNFWHCYDNEESRAVFSGLKTSKRVPAPQTYF
jgi:hypothetical protein